MSASIAGKLRVYVNGTPKMVPANSQTTLSEIAQFLQSEILGMFVTIPSKITYQFTTGSPSEEYPTPLSSLDCDLTYYNIISWIGSKDSRDAITLKFIIG